MPPTPEPSDALVFFGATGDLAYKEGDYIVIPRVLGEAVGLSPLLVLFSIPSVAILFGGFAVLMVFPVLFAVPYVQRSTLFKIAIATAVAAGIALLLAVARRIPFNDRFVLAGRWPKEGDPALASSLAGRRLEADREAAAALRLDACDGLHRRSRRAPLDDDRAARRPA